MRLQRPFVFHLDDALGAFERSINIAFFNRRLAADTLCLPDVIVKFLHGRKRRAWRCPRHFQRLRCANGVPFAVRYHCDEFFFFHDARAGDSFERALVDGYRATARRRWAHNACVDHAIYFDVSDVLKPSHHLFSDDFLRKCLADNFVFRRPLRLRLAMDCERITISFVPVELGIEVLAADELPITDRPARISR